MELSEILSAAKRLVSQSGGGGSILHSLSSNLDSYHAFLQDAAQERLRANVQSTLELLGIPEWRSMEGDAERNEAIALYCKFTKEGLSLLYLLDDALRRADSADREVSESSEPTVSSPSKHPPPPKALLASAEEKIVFTLLQFVVSLGLFPFLLPGADHLLCLKLSQSSSLWKAECPATVSACYLHRCCQVLIKMFNTPVVGATIASRHLSDALVALIQICYTPDDAVALTQQVGRRERDSDQTSTHSPHVGDLEGEIRKDGNGQGGEGGGRGKDGGGGGGKDDKMSSPMLTTMQREWCLEELSFLLNRTHQPLIVRELLSLQGPVTKAPKMAHSKMKREKESGGGHSMSTGPAKHPSLTTPKWLQRVCGKLLSERLMQKNGVHSTLIGIFDAIGGGGHKDGSGCRADWRKAQAVAHIIASCPAQASSVDDYYLRVCPQVLCLVQTPVEGGASLRVAAATISAMMTQQPSLARKHLLEPLVFPITQLTTNTVVPLKQLTDPSKDLESSIRSLNSLCVAVEPSSPLRASLLPYLPVLFDLWRACISASSKATRALLGEILTSVLSPLPPTGVVTFLKQLAGFPVAGREGGGRKWLSLAPRVAIKCGGEKRELIARVIEEGIEEEEGEEREREEVVGGIWSVEVMESVGQGILTLLKEELKFTGIVGQFFIECLSRVAAISCQDIGYQPHTPLLGQKDHLQPSSPRKEASNGASSDLLDIEQNMKTPTQQEAYNRSLALYLTASLSENMNSIILELASITQLLGVLSVILECHTRLHCTQSSSPPSSPVQLLVMQPDTETLLGGSISLSIALGYLSAILTEGTIKVKKDLRPQLSALLPSLGVLSARYPDPELKELAGDLQVCIVTLGSVWSAEMEAAARQPGGGKREKVGGREGGDGRGRGRGMTEKSPSTSNLGTAELAQKKEEEVNSVVDKPDHGHSSVISGRGEGYRGKLVEEIADSVPQATMSVTSGEREAPSNSQTPFQQCLDDLQDPLIPVQAHALVSLTKLIRTKNKESLAKSISLLKIFQENLHHSDSYIYLAAISGLVALGSARPREVLEVLCREYAPPQTSMKKKKRSEVDRETGMLKTESEKLTSAEKGIRVAENKDGKELFDFRLKLGEALVRVARNCGETLPQYSDLLLRTVLANVQDPQPLVRASALSNLAEVCRLLRHSLGAVHHEVLNCVSSILLSDTEPRVRQAALLVLTLLLRGQGVSAVHVLGGSLRDVYRLLKQVEAAESDPLTRAHAQAALGELDLLVRDWAFPEQSLEKKISII